MTPINDEMALALLDTGAGEAGLGKEDVSGRTPETSIGCYLFGIDGVD